jgi:hypothetical protein
MTKTFGLLLAFFSLCSLRTHGDLNQPQRFATRQDEIRYLLAKYNLDADWLRVAKLEAGAKLNSPVSRQATNFFGLHRAYVRTTTAIGTYGIYARYNSVDDNVRDISYWAQMSPRREGEPFDRWLKRRGWNHLPTYYRTLAQVRL